QILDAHQENVGSYHVQVMNASRYVTESHEAFLEIGPMPDILSQDKLEDVFAARDSLLGSGLDQSLVYPAAIAASTGGFLLVSLGTIDSQLVNNTTATTSLKETNHCGVLGGSSKWLGIRPLADGIMQVDTIGSAINTVLAIYTGTNLLTLRQVACDDNGAPDGIRSL